MWFLRNLMLKTVYRCNYGGGKMSVLECMYFWCRMVGHTVYSCTYWRYTEYRDSWECYMTFPPQRSLYKTATNQSCWSEGFGDAVLLTIGLASNFNCTILAILIMFYLKKEVPVILWGIKKQVQFFTGSQLSLTKLSFISASGAWAHGQKVDQIK